MVNLFGFDPKDKGSIPLPSATWESRLVAIAGGCKPLAFGLRRFESYLSHHLKI